MAGDEFAELLRELKERSGLSYGVLGKRLHVSASTLHRYANGDAVPADYAPVERLARVCRATPEELVELHRRWVLADALRRRKGASGRTPGNDGGGAAAGGTAAGAAAAGAAGGAATVGFPQAEGAEASGSSGAPQASGPTSPSAGDDDTAGPDGGPADGVPEPAVRRRPRPVALAGAAVVAAALATALVVNLVPGEDDDPGRTGAAGTVSSAAAGRPGATASTDGKRRTPSPSASDGAGPKASASRGAGAAGRDQQGGHPVTGAAAPLVATDPYRWEGPCSQHYLVDRGAAQVPPPPNETDARGWVGALGGVAGGRQMIALTVQGTGEATVVLDALHVRVVDKAAPLAWNDFAMGVGCGGQVDTASFHVDLDAGRPATRPSGGQRDFPYKVSESDPEVFYVFADARTHHVSWYLELDWSSGTKSGTVRVDDHGKPFRTSGNVGRPAYTYPLGGSEWGRDEYEPDVPG